jgi:hypothetical protein
MVFITLPALNGKVGFTFSKEETASAAQKGIIGISGGFVPAILACRGVAVA